MRVGIRDAQDDEEKVDWLTISHFDLDILKRSYEEATDVRVLHFKEKFNY